MDKRMKLAVISTSRIVAEFLQHLDEMPELSVDSKKRRRYRNLAHAYIVDHPDVDSIRFDVIALNVVGESQARLRHLRGAFGWDE